MGALHGAMTDWSEAESRHTSLISAERKETSSPRGGVLAYAVCKSMYSNRLRTEFLFLRWKNLFIFAIF